MARRKESAVRGAELVQAARTLFFEQGVDATSIEQITRAAGVAHGTFYLYFKTKDDAVNAVMAEIASERVEQLAALASAQGPSAIEKLAAVREALVDLSTLGAAPSKDLVSHYHGPEHRDVHDRLAHELNRRLVPVVAGIVRQGVAEGAFEVSDPLAAAAFVLSAAEGLDLLDAEAGDDAGRVESLMTFITRGLGACE